DLDGREHVGIVREPEPEARDLARCARLDLDRWGRALRRILGAHDKDRAFLWRLEVDVAGARLARDEQPVFEVVPLFELTCQTVLFEREALPASRKSALVKTNGEERSAAQRGHRVRDGQIAGDLAAQHLADRILDPARGDRAAENLHSAELKSESAVELASEDPQQAVADGDLSADRAAVDVDIAEDG